MVAPPPIPRTICLTVWSPVSETAFTIRPTSPPGGRLYLRTRGRSRHRQDLLRQLVAADDFGRPIN
jgi:hypothetical protein